MGVLELSWKTIDAGQVVGIVKDCQDSSVRGSTVLDMRPIKQVD